MCVIREAEPTNKIVVRCLCRHVAGVELEQERYGTTIADRMDRRDLEPGDGLHQGRPGL